MGKQYLIFFGPPGSGKGTQIEKISEKLKLPAISTGALFRREIENKTDLGKRVGGIIRSGSLVDDDTVNEIIAKRLGEPELKRGAILDGYPRNDYQLKFLISALNSRADGESSVIYAVLVDVSDEAVRERLGGRLTCTCGATYHSKNQPPKVNGICDLCGSALFTREDDKPGVIDKRLEIYHQAAGAVLDYFRKSGNLIVVNGEQGIRDVESELENQLNIAGIAAAPG